MLKLKYILIFVLLSISVLASDVTLSLETFDKSGNSKTSFAEGEEVMIKVYIEEEDLQNVKISSPTIVLESKDYSKLSFSDGYYVTKDSIYGSPLADGAKGAAKYEFVHFPHLKTISSKSLLGTVMAKAVRAVSSVDIVTGTSTFIRYGSNDDGDPVARSHTPATASVEITGSSSVCTDADKDNFCKESSNLPAGKVGGDCNDNDKTINPTAVEVCNKKDDDCDGSVDDGNVCKAGCKDADGDGYDNCGPFSSGDDGKKKDCNDNDASVNPGATESCNKKDDDCDGSVDEGGICSLCGAVKCEVNEQCTNNQCVCKAGFDKCSTKSCIDLNLDEENCGACGNKCATGELCNKGVCAVPKFTPKAGMTLEVIAITDTQSQVRAHKKVGAFTIFTTLKDKDGVVLAFNWEKINGLNSGDTYSTEVDYNNLGDVTEKIIVIYDGKSTIFLNKQFRKTYP